MLGIHVSKISKILHIKSQSNTLRSMLNAIIDNIIELKINAVQIFTHGPRNYNANEMDYNAIKTYCKAHNIYIVVHSTYLTQPWKINNENKSSLRSKTTLSHIKSQLKACHLVGAAGLVVHLPKYNLETNSSQKISETMKILKPLCIKFKVPILLEISAHKLDESYASPDHLNELCQTLKKKNKSCIWGICVDTAHIYASNIDISSATQAKKWISKLKYPRKIHLFHLNGTIIKFGSNKDVHAIPFAQDDVMWNAQDKDIKQMGGYIFVRFCKKNHIPIILEINRGTKSEAQTSLNVIKQLLKY